jgi:hypothetical protein
MQTNGFLHRLHRLTWENKSQMLKNLEGKSENKMGVRHSGPVIQARDIQAYLFFTCLSALPFLRAFQAQFWRHSGPSFFKI